MPMKYIAKSSAGALAFAQSLTQKTATTPKEKDTSLPLKNEKVSCPLEVIQTDYGKFARLDKQIEDEEMKEERRKKEEQALNNAAMAGCAHDHSKERQLFEKPTLEKIDAANRFRLEGNAAFAEKNYGLAAVNYRKALLQFDYTFPDTPEEESAFNKVKLPCHLNLAACKLQQKEYNEVFIQCRLALEMDPHSCKAFYRRGMAFLMQDHFDEAQESFNSALKEEPHNTSVLEAIKTLNKKRIDYKNTSKATYRKMFSSKPDTRKVEENNSTGDIPKTMVQSIKDNKHDTRHFTAIFENTTCYKNQIQSDNHNLIPDIPTGIPLFTKNVSPNVLPNSSSSRLISNQNVQSCSIETKRIQQTTTPNKEDGNNGSYNVTDKNIKPQKRKSEFQSYPNINEKTPQHSSSFIQILSLVVCLILGLYIGRFSTQELSFDEKIFISLLSNVSILQAALIYGSFGAIVSIIFVGVLICVVYE